MDESNSQTIVEKTSEIVAAFVSNNETTTTELPALIQAVHRALSGISVAAPEPYRYAAR
jgi:predicted transcriptional regulator